MTHDMRQRRWLQGPATPGTGRCATAPSLPEPGHRQLASAEQVGQVVPSEWRLIHMTDADWGVLEAYVARVIAVLQLSEWQVLVSHADPENDKAMADIDTTFGRKQAVLHVTSIFRELVPEAARHTVVHELCHLLSDDLKQTAGHFVPEEHWPVVRRREEEMVDRIARFVAPHLPLIPWSAA